jgi:hypothetical protein
VGFWPIVPCSGSRPTGGWCRGGGKKRGETHSESLTEEEDTRGSAGDYGSVSVSVKDLSCSKKISTGRKSSPFSVDFDQ